MPVDVARFTALHIPADAPVSRALTRLVALDALFAARPWPDRDELVRRFAAHGAGAQLVLDALGESLSPTRSRGGRAAVAQMFDATPGATPEGSSPS